MDACLVTPTQMPRECEDLIVIELHQRPINLTMLNKNGHSPDKLKDCFRWSLQGDNLELKLMPYLPISCLECSKKWFKDLKDIEQSSRNKPRALLSSQYLGESFVVSYLTPEMRMAQSLPWQVNNEFDPYTYTESLVILAKNATKASILALIESLKRQISN